MHSTSTNSDRIYAPTVGIYDVCAQVSWPSLGAVYPDLELFLDYARGVSVLQTWYAWSHMGENIATQKRTYALGLDHLTLQAGDHFALKVGQTTGATITLPNGMTSFSIHRVG